MLLKKITSSLATSGALLVLATGAVFASTDVTISGNGEDSVNTVKVNLTNTTSVYQSNATNVKNDVSSSASTGSNTISKTTNGNAKIDTGDATSMVSVMVAGGNNHLSSNPCGCVNGETTVTVKNNGADSTNKVKVKSKNTSQQGQHGETNVSTSVSSKAKTGKNKVKKATGGNSEVKTGDSESAVSVIVTGGHNYL